MIELNYTFGKSEGQRKSACQTDRGSSFEYIYIFMKNDIHHSIHHEEMRVKLIRSINGHMIELSSTFGESEGQRKSIKNV